MLVLYNILHKMSMSSCSKKYEKYIDKTTSYIVKYILFEICDEHERN